MKYFLITLITLGLLVTSCSDGNNSNSQTSQNVSIDDLIAQYKEKYEKFKKSIELSPEQIKDKESLEVKKAMALMAEVDTLGKTIETHLDKMTDAQKNAYNDIAELFKAAKEFLK
jgi:seryl-tRNA synthetase